LLLSLSPFFEFAWHKPTEPGISLCPQTFGWRNLMIATHLESCVIEITHCGIFFSTNFGRRPSRESGFYFFEKPAGKETYEAQNWPRTFQEPDYERSDAGISFNEKTTVL
jgi:hypothetical protein